MDAIADQLDVQVGQNDLTERLVLMSRQYGIEPQQLLQYLQQNNQLPAMFADVRRGLAVAAVVHGGHRHRHRRQRHRHHRVLRPARDRRSAEAAAQSLPGRSTQSTSSSDADADAEADDRPTTRLRRREVTL